MLYFTNYKLSDIVTSIDAEVLNQLLQEPAYNLDKTEILTDGFRRGFDMGYRGLMQRQDLSNNIPLNKGAQTDLWNKVMKEVKWEELQDLMSLFHTNILYSL